MIGVTDAGRNSALSVACDPRSTRHADAGLPDSAQTAGAGQREAPAGLLDDFSRLLQH